MPAIVTPKFVIPFKIARRANTVEQGTIDEVVQCIKAILKTPEGSREDNPRFGLPDQVFRQGGASLDEIRRAIQEFEPRADILADEVLNGLLSEVNIEVRVENG